MSGSFEVREGYLLLGYRGIYQVEKFLGEGTFGKVAKCRTIGSDERVAVKIVKQEFKDAGRKEQQALQEVSRINADRNNLVRCLDCFPYKSRTCIVFEMLDISLHDFLHQRDYLPLSISEIKAVTSQLLVALDALKSIDVVHCDIKPDNVMLVDQKSQPFKVRLIDFGLATNSSKLTKGTRMQNPCYRAPEVILGLPLDHSLDMWTLGYVLAVLYTGTFIHAWDSEYNIVKAMVGLQGMPESALLDRGMYTRRSFSPVQQQSGVRWELDTAELHVEKTGEKVNKDYCRYFNTYQDLVDFYYDETKVHEVQQFVDLLQRMLLIDPAKRITPKDALRHPFVSGVQQPTVVGVPRVTQAEEPYPVPGRVPVGPEEPKAAGRAAEVSTDSWVNVGPVADPPHPSFSGNQGPVPSKAMARGSEEATTKDESKQNQVTEDPNQEPVSTKGLSTQKSFRGLRKLISKVCRFLKFSRG